MLTLVPSIALIRNKIDWCVSANAMTSIIILVTSLITVSTTTICLTLYREMSLFGLAQFCTFH
jgi:hypothetical protein